VPQEQGRSARRIPRWLRVPAALIVIPAAAAGLSGRPVVAVIVVTVMVLVLVVAGLCWVIAELGRPGYLAVPLNAARRPAELPVPLIEEPLPDTPGAGPVD
jgi:hypothetical protein